MHPKGEIPEALSSCLFPNSPHDSSAQGTEQAVPRFSYELQPLAWSNCLHGEMHPLGNNAAYPSLCRVQLNGPTRGWDRGGKAATPEEIPRIMLVVNHFDTSPQKLYDCKPHNSAVTWVIFVTPWEAEVSLSGMNPWQKADPNQRHPVLQLWLSAAATLHPALCWFFSTVIVHLLFNKRHPPPRFSSSSCSELPNANGICRNKHK